MNLYASLDGDVWATVLESIKTSASNRRKTLRISSGPGEREAFLRPYIILRNAKRKIMKQADVAIAFEGHLLGIALMHKEEKYQSIETHYEKAWVSGDGAGSSLSISRSYCTTKQKTVYNCTSWVILRAIITGCIRHSCQVWGLHLAGDCTRRA